jgi:Fe-Mn family superoxide dismutase
MVAHVLPQEKIMPDASIDRRRLLGAGATMAAGAGLAMTSPPALAQVAATAPTRPAYSPQPMPLPFAPGSIPGLSEKLLNSHHANNYVGAVKRIAAISGQIASLDPGTAPGFMLNGLKREELIATNSMILHELYFGNLGPAGTASPGLRAMLERDFGGVAQWQAQFGAMGKALGGGSGWVILQYDHRDRRLVNQWANDHTMALAGATPIIVLDMYEHAYAMDYGAKATAYVDAVMAALNWTVASTRFAGAVAG